MKISREWLCAGLVCAALTLAPGAFAQHGGGHGGGGGGGHFGGGGGGWAPAPSASRGSSAPGPSRGTANSGSGTHSNSTSAKPATTANGSNPANPNGGGRFVGQNATQARANGIPAGPRTPVRGYYPYYPYGYGFYGYPYFGLGYYGFGFGGPCDPFFGCYGFGAGYGWGGGFGLGYGFGGGYGIFGGGDVNGWTYASSGNAVGSGGGTAGVDYTLDASGANGTDANATVAANPAEANGTADASGPTVTLNDAGTAPAAPATPTLLYMKDGSSFAVSDYWLAGGKLHYVTSYGGENKTDLGKLDIQRTVDENAKQGNQFSLKSQPREQK